MKVTYIKLQNVAGIYVGQDKEEIEISFENSKNKIVSIIGRNGNGKTILLSSISPFAYVTSLDDRSSLPYILKGRNGYKEIHYQNGKDTFIIKHYYKATGDTHTVKSYFVMNGEELNENGNVRSFNALVETYLGLTEEMMRLIRLGTNVNSFITLPPAKRKEYIGKLISEIDLYLQIYKKINEDIRVVKAMIQNNATNLYNCHITDIVVEKENLKSLEKSIKQLEKERDEEVSKLSKIRALIAENNIDDLRRKQKEAEVSLGEFDKVEAAIKEEHLENTSIDQLVTKRSELSESSVDIKSKIRSYRISIDTTLRNIERLEVAIKKVTSNNDIQSLVDAITSTREAIQQQVYLLRNYVPMGTKSDDVHQLIARLTSFNQIAQMIYTFGNKPIDVYLKLRKENKSVDKFLKEQAKKSLSRISETDLKALLDQVFQDEDIITPNCDSEYMNCPYYRLSDTIVSIKDKLEEESFDDETLRYIQVIASNVDNIMNELDRTRNIKIPGVLRSMLSESEILRRLDHKLPLFDLSGFQEYLSMVREHEIYMQNITKLKQYEYQLSIYRSSGIDAQLEEIRSLKESIDFYKHNIQTLEGEIQHIDRQISEVDNQIGLVTKYIDGKKYRKVFESTLETTRRILEPLESAESEKREIEYTIRRIDDQIQTTRSLHRELDSKIIEYNRLMAEEATLKQKFKDLNIIQEATSTKKGIPVIYMKRYLGKIQKLANSLLKLIYDDEFQLAKFKVTQDTFEVPYIKNGTKIPDVKYGSQSEVALVNMALSFALAKEASETYNIILLDEIDAGLDDDNRSAFLKMLDMQMSALHAEQVFIISHNMSQMINVPMDCILMSDVGTRSKLQNVIYE